MTVGVLQFPTVGFNSMGQKRIPGETVHKLPRDLRSVIGASDYLISIWDDLTPLARNEWICWITSGKKQETRTVRIDKAVSKLKSGMRRPCCWPGCPHR
jgi:uncharacterized protein YdeI (YjbR/CyaY-like superfamily)